MGKSKETKVKAVADPIKSVKNGGVTKPSKSSDAKSKKIAKDVAAKAVNGKKEKKAKKVESDSESDSDSDSSASSGSDSDSEFESEEEKPAPKAEKANGKKAAKKEESESESESDSDSGSDSSDSDSDEEEEEKAVKKEAKAESDSDSDSESDSDSSDSDSDSDSEEKTEEPSKKRKADDEEPAAAKKAKTDDAEEAGAEEAAEPEQGTTLFAGNLGWKVDDNLLYEEFKVCEGLIGARVITDREQQRSRGFGYVDFDTAANAKAAFDKMQGYFIEGRELKLDFSTARPKNNDGANGGAADRAKKYGDTISPESDTLFVGNLPFHADEDSVSAFFNEVSSVKSLRLPTDMESGRPKGFGYVSFYSIEDAKKAFEQLNGQDCAGRNVRLDYSTPKPRNDFGGGRGGGGGFGGRGGGRGGFGGRGGGRGGFGDRGGRGGGRGGFGGRGGGGGFQGKKTTF